MNIKNSIILVLAAVAISTVVDMAWSELTKPDLSEVGSNTKETIVVGDTLSTDKALTRSDLLDSYEIWYKWIVFVDYEKSKISIPNGKDFDWIRRAYPHMYQRQTKRIFINDKHVPEKEKILKYVNLEEDTEIVGITALQYGWYYGNVPTE